MEHTFWLVRDSENSDYELWKERPNWNGKEWVWGKGNLIGLLKGFCPREIRYFFNIKWKGGKRSIRKLTVSF